MSVDPRTVQTYDNSAEQMANHFNNYGQGVAKKEIDLAFSFVTGPVGQVVEIGCGAGKDAAEIAAHSNNYLGFDPSSQLIGLAKNNNPGLKFIQSDGMAFEYPQNLTAVFAFASLLHLNKYDFAATCSRVATALKIGGVLCITLKEADDYSEIWQHDEFGERLFYLYSAPLATKLATSGTELQLVHESHTVAGPKSKKWMCLVFQKTSR